MKILIIGGKGYIGTRLIDFLLQKSNDIVSLDSNNYSNKISQHPNVKYFETTYQNMPKHFFEQFTDIILFAGQGSVNNCKNINNVIDNNIKNFAWLLDIIKPEQKLIYASSSSVYGNTNNLIADEEFLLSDPYNYYDWSKQCIDKLAKTSNKQYYGLRFGTVNGYSRNMRNDIMINSMYFNYKNNNKIFVSNQYLNRPILGINDLCNAIYTIILNGSIEKSGIYNLNSFNCAVKDIAYYFTNNLGIEAETPDDNKINYDNKTKYDFKINSDKFIKTFNFKFNNTIENITDEIIHNWDNIENIENRNNDNYISYKKIDQCRVCENKTTTLLDFGLQPLANKYITETEKINNIEEYFPLNLQLCNHCYHTQLNCVVNPIKLFKNYIYVSGTSQTLKNNFKEFGSDVISKYIKNNEQYDNKTIKILEIACNDGSQLDEILNYKRDFLPDYNIITVGVDPAENIYKEISSKKSHDIFCEFFSQSTVDKLIKKYGDFDIIIAANVFAHIDYPSDFLKYINQLMTNKSMLYIQTSQKNMILQNQFDTIYHEHLSFFNTNSMKYICDKNNLTLANVYENYIHGTSYIFEICKYDVDNKNVDSIIQQERELGLYDIQTYNKYKLKCLKYKTELNNLIFQYKLNGRNIVAYGSTAKSMTVLNFCNINYEYIDFMIDENPLKNELYTPGSNIIVKPISALNNIQENTVIIITAWNFYDEIKEKIIKQIKKINEINKTNYSITLLNIDSLKEELI